VFSCWNGATAFSARPLLGDKKGYAFAALQERSALKATRSCFARTSGVLDMGESPLCHRSISNIRMRRLRRLKT
jgi:hypothetical protein